STKAFTTQLAALFSLCLALAKVKGRLSPQAEADAIDQLRYVPGSIQHALNLEPQVQAWAERFAQRDHALFLVRGIHYPLAHAAPFRPAFADRARGAGADARLPHGVEARHRRRQAAQPREGRYRRVGASGIASAAGGGVPATFIT